MQYTYLNQDDLQHLSGITQSNKLPKLQILDLSKIITLTGCLSSLLPDNPHGLPDLLKLDSCTDTKLNKGDLQTPHSLNANT